MDYNKMLRRQLDEQVLQVSQHNRQVSSVLKECERWNYNECFFQTSQNMKLLISGKAPPTELSWFISRLTRGYGRYITIEGLIHQPISGVLGGLPDKSAFASGVSRQSVRVLIQGTCQLRCPRFTQVQIFSDSVPPDDPY